jgi:hypothetical protein
VCSTTCGVQEEPTGIPLADAIVKLPPPPRPSRHKLRVRRLRHPQRHRKQSKTTHLFNKLLLLK